MFDITHAGSGRSAGGPAGLIEAATSKARSSSRTSDSTIQMARRSPDITFDAEPGRIIALVGLTGAGKTTLVSLIPRFYAATAGQVPYDGIDVRDYRNSVAARADCNVLQEAGAVLRHDAENPRYGRLETQAGRHRERTRAALRTTSSSDAQEGYEKEVRKQEEGVGWQSRQREL